MEAIVTVGLSFGDEGKGKIVDALVRKNSSGLVVRYCGGSQAAHSVVCDDGTMHIFAQLGAGSFNKGTETLLGAGMLVDPLALMIEADIFNKKISWDVYPLINVDMDCFVITPFHQAMNRIRELSRGDGRHGSCGKGIGETKDFMSRHPGPHFQIRHLHSKTITKKHLIRIRDILQKEAVELLTGPMTPPLLEQFEWFKWDIDALVESYSSFVELVSTMTSFEVQGLFEKQKTPIIFEGSQGVLLDEHHGFTPYNTWSNLLPDAAYQMLPNDTLIRTVGILRTLTTRHGAGPFPSEDLGLTQAFPDNQNPTNPWQQEFRVGHFDLSLLRYALSCVGTVDYLAVTHTDLLPQQDFWRMAYRYELDGEAFSLSVIPDFHLGTLEQQLVQTENLQIADCIYRDVPQDKVLETIELVSEYARAYIHKYGSIDSVYDQMRIFNKQLAEENQFPSTIDVLVTDSPIFLGFGYALELRKENNKKKEMNGLVEPPLKYSNVLSAKTSINSCKKNSK